MKGEHDTGGISQLGCCSKIPWTCLKENVFLTFLETVKSKIQVLADSLSVESSLSGLQIAPLTGERKGRERGGDNTVTLG